MKYSARPKMSLSVILQMEMREQLVDFVTAIRTWRRGAYTIHACGFSAVNSRICYPQLNGWDEQWIHRGGSAYICSQRFLSLWRPSTCILICNMLTEVDRTVSAFYLPWSYISRRYKFDSIFPWELVSHVH